MTTYANYQQKLEGHSGSDCVDLVPKNADELTSEKMREILKNREEIKRLSKINQESLGSGFPVGVPFCLKVEGVMTTFIVDRPSVQAVVIKNLDITMKAKTTKKDLVVLESQK